MRHHPLRLTPHELQERALGIEDAHHQHGHTVTDVDDAAWCKVEPWRDFGKLVDHDGKDARLEDHLEKGVQGENDPAKSLGGATSGRGSHDVEKGSQHDLMKEQVAVACTHRVKGRQQDKNHGGKQNGEAHQRVRPERIDTVHALIEHVERWPSDVLLPQPTVGGRASAVVGLHRGREGRHGGEVLENKT